MFLILSRLAVFIVKRLGAYNHGCFTWQDRAGNLATIGFKRDRAAEVQS